MRRLMAMGVFGVLVAMGEAMAEQGNSAAQLRLREQVRHELAMLPYYTVFDNLMFQVRGNRVMLLGQVSRPALKADSERVVRRIEGVAAVDNQIEVLPLSAYDDRLRLALFRALYGNDVLQRSLLSAVPPVRIIVKNGNVTLEGTVEHETERALAGLLANGVSGVFSVTNNLRVDR